MESVRVGRPRKNMAKEGYYTPEAIEARRAYQQAYKAANREHLREYFRDWREENRDKTVEYNRRYEARKRAEREAARAPPAPTAPIPDAVEPALDV